jgi:hypothetical protein
VVVGKVELGVGGCSGVVESASAARAHHAYTCLVVTVVLVGRGPGADVDTKTTGCLSVGKGVAVQTLSLTGLSGVVSVLVIGRVVADATGNAPSDMDVCIVVGPVGSYRALLDA